MNIFQKLVANWSTALSGPVPRKTKTTRTTTRVNRNPPDIAIYETRLRPGSATGPLPAPKPKRAPIRPRDEGSGGGSQPDTAPLPMGECCADLEAMKLICDNLDDPRNGADITSVAETNVVNGVALVTIGYTDAAGLGHNGRFPMCDLPPDDGGGRPGPGGDPDPSGCCFDAETMKIVGCNDSTAMGLMGATVLSIVHTDQATGMVTIVVQLPNGSQHTLTLPLCGLPDTDLIPTPPEEEECCYDQQMNRLVCGDNIPPNPLHMAEVTLEAINIVDGVQIATVYVNGNPQMGMRVPLCPLIECCLDLSTGTLICTEESSIQYNELEVSVIEVGKRFARVSHSSLPGGTAYVPLCPTTDRGDCCYNQDTGLIECTDTTNPLHGMPAGIVTDPGPDANGIHYVEVSSAAGQFRLLLCGEGECPPLYCCVNEDTGNFVCPGIPELNGQAADVANYIEDGGYRWAVLSNGQMVPVCGKDCPPALVCAEGLWMSPTGECLIPSDVPGECPECPVCPEPDPTGGVCPQCPPGYLLDTATNECVQPPTCPQCPPGFLLDTSTGQCVQCPGDDTPRFPPNGGGGGGDDEDCCLSDGEKFWPNAQPCCGSCANGGDCEGDHDHAREGNPSFLEDTCPIGWTMKNGRCVAPWWPEKPLAANHVWQWVRKTNVPGWHQVPLGNEWIQPYLKSRPKCPEIGQGKTHTVLAVMPSKQLKWFCIHEKDTYHAGAASRMLRSGGR